jgi:TRAP transporter TAXI family solute receptor
MNGARGMNRHHHPILRAFAGLALAVATALPATAQELRFFRIGTGSISGVYFPVGGLIASAISHPPGASLCGQGGSCGVPGLVAVAQASRGSVVNARNIGAGRIESALIQADVAYFAHRGMGAFGGSKAVSGLRAIASLYPEAVHVVVRKDSPIRSIKRVSIDLKGSGTRAVAMLVLKGIGIDAASLRQLNSQIGPAVDRLKSGRLDAFFFVGGFPAPSITRLAADLPLRLLPLTGGQAPGIRKKDPFLSSAVIPAATYGMAEDVQTLAVGALWAVSDKVSEKLVYGITRALWHPATRAILDQGPSATRQMRLENASKGVAIPFHPGAERFYREKGLLKKPAPKDKPVPKGEAAPKLQKTKSAPQPNP